MSGRVRRRRRRRYSPEISDEEDDGEEDEGGAMPRWKMGVVIGVIVLCFAMLYPSIVQPLLTSLWSKSTPTTPRTPAATPRTRPDMQHPGMRMQAAQQPPVDATTGSRGPVFTWMLPLYTVGVVVFLLYTLFKIMFKSKKKEKRKSSRRRASVDDSAESDADEVGNMSRSQLRSLQSRLKQTEEAMAKILSQLEQVSTNTVQPDSTISPDTQGPPQDTAYLKDLEKALKDFKDLSAVYNNAEQRNSPPDESSEDEEDEAESEENNEIEPDDDNKSEEDVDEETNEKIKKDEQLRRRRTKQ